MKRLLFSGLLALAVLMLFSVSRGGVKLSLPTVYQAIFCFDAENPHHLFVMELRFPRVVASALVGAALAVSGAVMQGLTRNPMADSGLLGLNAGAVFALSVCFAFFPGMEYSGIIVFSFSGAALGAFLVLGMYFVNKNTDTMRFLLAGAAVGALFTALSQGISLAFQVSKDVMFWSMGGVAGSDWSQIKIIAPLILAAVFGAVGLSGAVSVISLGEDVAKELGIRTRAVTALCSLLVLILAGTSAAVVGSVGFVGLIVPHVTRYAVGKDYRKVIPASAVAGACFLVLADLFARTFHPPFEVPLGVMTSLVGVPFFLYVSRKERRQP